MFSLGKRNTTVPNVTGKAGTETAASLTSTILNNKSARQARQPEKSTEKSANSGAELECRDRNKDRNRVRD